MIINILIFLVPIIIFIIYTFLTYKKAPFEYDAKFIRRIYYLFVLIWMSLFIKAYYKYIKNITLFKVNKHAQNYVNLFIIIILLSLISIIWEYMFVSCKTLKAIKFKDTEITVDDVNDVKYIENVQEEEKIRLYNVLNAKIKVIKYINYKFQNDFDIDDIYQDVIQKYSKNRQNLKIYIYQDNNIKQIQKNMKITPSEISSIIFSIDTFGFCFPKEFRNGKYLFAKIETKFLDYNLILILESDLLIDKEHMVLIDIIDYLELKINVEGLNLQLSQRANI